MRLNTLYSAMLLLAAAAAPAVAQEARSTFRQGWLGFAYETLVSPGERQRLVIREIVEDSPAARAGLVAGDTLLRIGDLAANEQLVSSLRLSLAPGDPVRMLVRRGGHDIEFTLIAAERPANIRAEGMHGVVVISPDSVRRRAVGMHGIVVISPDSVRRRAVGMHEIVVISPDSVRRRLRILSDSLLKHVDTLRLPSVYIERFQGRPGARYHIMPRDSLGFFFGTDSLQGGRAFVYARGDNMRVRIDSVWSRMAPLRRFAFDSAFTFFGDSTRRGITTFRFPTDGAGGFTARWDSVARLIPLEARSWPGVTMMSVRAIAGAELSDLTPGLASHFDVERGVLVLRVPPGTPAERSGIKEADVVVSANGREVATVGELRDAVMRAGSNQPVTLVVVRDGKRMTLELKR